MSDNKKCWACGKTLTGGEKLGLCDRCLNKYGSLAAAVGTGVLTVLTVGGKFLVKNGGKILKIATKIVKR
jgi:hypothetical protein